MKPFVWLALAAAGLPPAPALAGGRSTLARAAVEAIVRKSGKEAAKEGSEALARRLEAQVARHGVVILDAARQVGPDAVRFVEEAGNHGAVAARLLARYGEKATVLVHSRRALAFVARHGDAAAKALLRHPGIAEPLIEALGESSAKALSAIGPRGGRRLAQMVEDGTLASLGRTREVLAVIGRYGDKAMEFIWKHKGALAVGTVLVAFLADSEPFLNGARDITKTVAANAIAPLAEAPAVVAREAASQINWSLVIAVGAGGWTAARVLRRCVGRRAAVSPGSSTKVI
ncbi:MAG TPA: hypothetical protein VKE94_23175 [Gemmataceae bacterium]|nr:hypothetical protein [Gemmataceae bacterium]